jgi:putative copper resistance protein D
LYVSRTVHFAATAVTAGNIIFQAAIAGSALRGAAAAATRFRSGALKVAWFGLAVAVISGAVWLLLQAASMSGMPLNEALTAGALSTVISDTEFGEVTIVRAGLAICLAACLACDRVTVARWCGLAASLAFAASIAWTGHAAATFGAVGYLHLAADALHVVAAAAWVGGLASLVLLLAAAHSSKAPSVARDAVGRFSTLGIVSVATLVLSGLINAAILVGSVRALIVTDYGQLLLLKLALVAVMLIFALTNRLLLTPWLAKSGDVAIRWIARNSAIEFALGLSILAIVGVLGTMHPAIHLLN